MLLEVAANARLAAQYLQKDTRSFFFRSFDAHTGLEAFVSSAIGVRADSGSRSGAQAS